MKRGLKIISAARIYRTFPSLMLIIFAIAITEKINTNIILLAVSLISLYAAGSLLNSIKDNDHNLPKSTKIIPIILSILAITISLYDKLILFANLSWIIFGYLYNTSSRKILFGDGTLLALTHYFTPLFFGLLILGENTLTALTQGTIIYIIFWFIMPMKNLKGSKEDKKRGYKTIMTHIKNGKNITLILFWISFILISTYSLTFKINEQTIFITSLLILYTLATIAIKRKEEAFSLYIIRLSMLIFFLSLIYYSTNIKSILLTATGLIIIFFVNWILTLNKMVNKK